VIPADLKKRPFTLHEARAAGLTRRVLASKSWRRIGPSLYCWADLEVGAWQLLQAWHLRLPNAVFSGLTAAWLHRLDVDPCHPVEIAVPPASGVRSRPNLVVRRFDLHQTDVTTVRGLATTTLQRTFRDLSRRLPEVEVLVLADAALRLKLGRFADLAERAESPMETRLRWLLLKAGLPRPQVQTDLHDSADRFVGRADLYYPAARLVIEYDGTNHRDRLVEDNRRQNLLLNAGYRLLRFTAADIHQRPNVVTSEVSQALRTALQAAAASG
jgi:very-short-patch-repair endonuclease